jgi:hypothetical protein
MPRSSTETETASEQEEQISHYIQVVVLLRRASQYPNEASSTLTKLRLDFYWPALEGMPIAVPYPYPYSQYFIPKDRISDAESMPRVEVVLCRSDPELVDWRFRHVIIIRENFHP